MKRHRTTIITAWLVAAATAATTGGGAIAAEPVKWSATDATGAAVAVPAPDRTTVLAFVRPDQPQSRQAIEQIASAVARTGASAVQVVVVVSGPDAPEKAKALVGNGTRPWPVVVDADYAASGKLNVHVWPTTLLVRPDGEQTAHLPGLAKSFESDLSAHLAFASGQIDQKGLDERLATRPIVADSPEHAAARHAQVAERLLAKGQVDDARREVSAGLALTPGDVALRLANVRVLLAAGETESALAALEGVEAGSVPPWQLQLLRGKALIAAGRWDDARAVLPDALKLNPHPAEAHYLVGLVHEHAQDWPRAAESFKRACEASGLRGR
jgi:tetratricopeptide (TPR) repeat protein